MKCSKLLLIILLAVSSNLIFAADPGIRQVDVFALDRLLERLINTHNWDTPREIAESLDEVLNDKQLQSMNNAFGVIEHFLLDRLNTKKIDLNISMLKWTALHYAAENKWVNVIEFLINAGLDVNAQNNAGNTPLHYASIENIENRCSSAIITLLKAGAKKDILNHNEQTPEQLARRYSCEYHDLADLIRDWNLECCIKMEEITLEF